MSKSTAFVYFPQVFLNFFLLISLAYSQRSIRTFCLGENNYCLKCSPCFCKNSEV